MKASKYFILTVDTEPDNEWSRPGLTEMTRHNARAIPRFHALCREFGISPVYLVDYQMSSDPALRKYLPAYLEKGECEIGAHLHPWSTPPYEHRVTNDDFKYHPFCTEYPLNVFLAKLESLVKSIKENFGVSPETFRAGRYVISGKYALSLKDYGFRVDCSVTPLRRWEPKRNAPGSDYTNMTPEPFFWDKDKKLLEIPLSAMIIKKKNSIFNPFRFSQKDVNWFFRYKKYKSLEYFLKKYIDEASLNLLQGMLHSSELVLGGCFKNKGALDKYWKALRRSFELITHAGYQSKTLSEYSKLYSS